MSESQLGVLSAQSEAALTELVPLARHLFEDGQHPAVVISAASLHILLHASDENMVRHRCARVVGREQFKPHSLYLVCIHFM